VFCVIRGGVLVVRHHPRERKLGKAHEQLHLVVVDGVTAGDSLVFEAVPFLVVHGLNFKDLRVLAFPVVDDTICVTPEVSAECRVRPLLAGLWVYLRDSHASFFQVSHHGVF